MSIPLQGRRAVVALGFASAAWLAALLFAAPGMAARATPGGHYVGFPPASWNRAESLAYPTAELRVSRDGRRLAAAQLQIQCQDAVGFSDLMMTLSFRRNPDAAIRRDGRFRVSRLGGRRRFRLAGRFVTPRHVRLFYSARILPRTVEGRGRVECRSTDWASPAALYRDGIPPFSGCGSQRATTLLWADTGRVFQQITLARNGNELLPHVYACLFASPSKRFELGQNYDDERLRTFRMAGPFVAFIHVPTWPIEVRDLRDGSLVSRPDTYGWLWDLALKDNGSLAWTTDRGTREVWSLDSNGQHLLDSGPDLVLESLEINGSTLYWLNGTTTRSATLD